jgi:tRNA(Ile)-lysidine synthase
MNLLQQFQQFIQQQNLFHIRDKLLLAVSGGVDSVVLCELCKQSGYDYTIAHCNFQLRGEESERDEKFVRNLGKKYGVEVMVKKFETEKYAEQKKISIQEAARDLRYAWFAELIGNKQSATGNENVSTEDTNCQLPIANWILTAHHADDNIETVLMNFCRGTGLHGLEGIPVAPLYIRRPLLGFWKEELIEFAKQNKLEFVEDSSNLSSKYTRNLFRNEIIPLISKVYPQVKENLRDNINRFKEIGKLYSISVGEFKKKFLKNKGDEIHIPVKQLMAYSNRALIYEIISDFGFTEKHIDEVIKLAESESGKFIQSPTTSVRIIKFRNWFIISKHKSPEASTFIIEEGVSNWQFAMGNMQIKVVSNCSRPLAGPIANSTACLDAKEISFPLILRKWKEGDYFYPLGMKKKKKLARFFIDQKLSKTDKEKIWVLEMSKKIIWVVGLRIDERFKITDKTKKVLKFSLETS